MRFPVIIQMYASENGLTTLAMILAYYKKFIPLNILRENCAISRNGTSVDDLCSAASHFSLDAKVLDVDADTVLKQQFPIVVLWNHKNYAIVTKVVLNRIVHMVDAKKGDFKINIKKFKSSYGNKAIIFTPNETFQKEGKQIVFSGIIFERIQKYKLHFTLTFIFTLFMILLNTFQINFQRQILDNADKYSSKPLFYNVILLSTISLIFLINFFKSKKASDVNYKYSLSSTFELLKKLIYLPLSFFEKTFNYELVDRIETAISIDNILIKDYIPKLINSLTVFVYIYLFLEYNKTLAILYFIIEIIHAIVIIRLQNLINIKQRSTIISTINANTTLINVLDIIDTIKSIGSERLYFTIWNRQQRDYENNIKSNAALRSLIDLISSVHDTFMSAVVLFVGAYFIVHGKITLGILSAFQALYTHMHSSITNILNINEFIEKIHTTILRVNDIKSEKTIPIIELPKDKDMYMLNGNLSVQDVFFSYNSADKPAISNISFEASKGELVAIVGPSGCGKTTLLKTLSHCYKPTLGKILYDGKERNEIPDIVFHKSINTIEQQPIMFKGTISENIKLFNDEISDNKVVEATKSAKIYDSIIKNSPDGFDANISDQGKNFSGGEIQRMELARALAINPSIFLLDEFTSALDTITEKDIFNEIRSLKKTCILAAHRFSTIMLCDKILVMQNGKIIAQGKHSDLYKNCKLYKELIDIE